MRRDFLMTCYNFIEGRGGFMIIWLFMYVQIKYLKNQRFLKRFIDAGVRSNIFYIGYLRWFDKANYTHHVIFVSSVLLCLSLM